MRRANQEIHRMPVRSSFRIVPLASLALIACAAPVQDPVDVAPADSALGIAIADPPQPSDEPTGADLLLAEARRQVAAMRQSKYTHSTYVDEGAGTFNYDCSGFVGYALQRAVPEAFFTLQDATVNRPVAASFEAFFASLEREGPVGRWRSVRRVADLAPGDVIAWLQAPSVPSSNTGHVVIVREPPRRSTASEWRIAITDSTASPHGASDSRAEDDATGLGTGSIVLVTDDAGAPRAYRWSLWSQSPIVETEIALGHVE
jgi:cell wall-associated NlpC family hydrolase